MTSYNVFIILFIRGRFSSHRYYNYIMIFDINFYYHYCYAVPHICLFSLLLLFIYSLKMNRSGHQNGEWYIVKDIPYICAYKTHFFKAKSGRNWGMRPICELVLNIFFFTKFFFSENQHLLQCHSLVLVVNCNLGSTPILR